MYIKTISEFLWDVDSDFQGAVLQVLNANRSVHDGAAEKQSWKESLPVLADILKNLPREVKEQCEIVLEARYMIEEKRADVVLVGQYEREKVIIIIENKRWSDLFQYEANGESSVWDPYHKQMVDHPSRQVNHYRTTLMYTNQYVQKEHIKIYTMVYMQNGTKKEKASGAGPFHPRYKKLCQEAPIFTGEEQRDIISFICGKISGGERGVAEKIYSSDICYSEEYKEILKNVFENSTELRNTLDEYQSALFDEIASELEVGKEKKIFLVEGKRGTGKTFVAVALLAYLYKTARFSDKHVRYVERNKDPRKILKNTMQIPAQAMMASLKGQNVCYDCLICDESHRMREQVFTGEDERSFIRRFLELSRISVFFYDENQSVHVLDHVTRERIIENAVDMGIPRENILERKLVYQHRCQEADRFLDTVDRLLDHPELGLDDIERFSERDPYKVVLFDDPEKMFQAIREKNFNHGERHPSRVLAGKGRSFNRDWEWIYKNRDYHRCKTIAPLWHSDQKLYTWNFGDYGPDETFASDEKSVELVGCVDTSQGLDFEYVGVIIAPDLVYDPESERIEVNIAGHQESDDNTGKSEIYTYDRRIIEKVIKNTYRVLLSRGEKGCYIYCCDKELHRYLSKIIEVKTGRKEGVVKYVDINMQYAYIESQGSDYAVSESTIARMKNAEQILVKRNKVTFNAKESRTGKYYAVDIRLDIKPLA